MTKAMIAFLIALVFHGVPAVEQDVPKPGARSLSAETLGFEGQHKGDMPQGWAGGPAGTIFVDGKTVHSGQWAVRLERSAESPSRFSAITQSIPMDFSGGTVELRGFLRTQDVVGSAGLWMREDGVTPGLEFDNMQGRHLQGSTEWTEYSIKLPVHPDARRLFFGVLLSGTGKMWADDLQLLVDGKPAQEAPRVERPKTAIDLDREFDAGSGIGVSSLTKIQTENLVTLGRVWGFLKYHHPLVTSGKRHWDYELFRILPAVVNAPDRPSANAAMLRWIDAMGPVAACNPCAKLDETVLHLRPDVGWLSDEKRFGAELSRSLRRIYDNRPATAGQFYLSLTKNGNASFQNEPAYENFKFPDPGFRILSVYRFWNIIEYWSPYRDVLGENWDKVLAEFIPRMVAAGDADAYQREMMALIARAHDTHANLWSSLQARPPVGDCLLPVNLRFVGNRAVVLGFPVSDDAAKDTGSDTGLKIGDVITELEGVPVSRLVKKWTPFYADSNDAARLRDIAASMTRGECGQFSIGVLRGHQKFTLQTRRVSVAGRQAFLTHDRPGETFQVLPGNVAYLKLSSVKAADAAHYVESAAATKGLIIDIRNYPSDFMVFALGSLLVSQETPFVQFTSGDLANPGAFHWSPPLLLKPQNPHYSGKVVVLVDETSQSQAEYTSMAFRSATGAVVIGSTTAGADGDVSPFALPGGLRTMISGLGIFYPDKRPTQRIGIVPDVVVKPTVEGIRAGKDEVLEEALRRIQGPK